MLEHNNFHLVLAHNFHLVPEHTDRRSEPEHRRIHSLLVQTSPELRLALRLVQQAQPFLRGQEQLLREKLLLQARLLQGHLLRQAQLPLPEHPLPQDHLLLQAQRGRPLRQVRQAPSLLPEQHAQLLPVHHVRLFEKENC